MLKTKKMRVVGALIAALFVVFVAAKCGDAEMFRLSPSDWDESAERGFLFDLNGATVELVRVSSRCGEDVSESLKARVGAELEFPAESVVKLKSSCAGGPGVQLDVDVQGRSVVYDFCNVAKTGQFPDAEFEGFVITDIFHSVAPIRSVTIDQEASTMAMNDAAISFDEDTIRVNLAGKEYDETCRVKLDVILDTEPNRS